MRAFLVTFFCIFTINLAQSKIVEIPTVAILLNELQSELISLEHTVDPLNKQFSCYHIGKSQILASLINDSLKSSTDLEKKERRLLDSIDKKLQNLNKYCSNKSKKITIDAMGLLLKRRILEAKVAKSEARLQEFQLISNFNIVTKHELNILQKLKDLSIELPTQFGSTFREDIAAEDFKPESCLAIGRVVPMFEIAGLIESSVINDAQAKVLVETIKNDKNLRFIIDELKSICFDERGFSKYVRDVKNLQSKLQVSEI
jgi:hypothetical protein